jgi:hydroxymethylbilane synthase
VLIARDAVTLATLPHGARVGTSSVRRAAQLLAARPDLQLLPIRGNVDTRLRKALDGEYDAVVLAAAGVRRLGLAEYVRETLPFAVMLPAPGQGAMAVQCRVDDVDSLARLAALDHAPTRAAVTAERALLAALGGGCSAPIAAHAEADAEGHIRLDALWASTDGRDVRRASGTGNNPRELGARLAEIALSPESALRSERGGGWGGGEILVTRPRAQAADLCERLAARGAVPIPWATIATPCSTITLRSTRPSRA